MRGRIPIRGVHSLCRPCRRVSVARKIRGMERVTRRGEMRDCLGLLQGETELDRDRLTRRAKVPIGAVRRCRRQEGSVGGTRTRCIVGLSRILYYGPRRLVRVGR